MHNGHGGILGWTALSIKLGTTTISTIDIVAAVRPLNVIDMSTLNITNMDARFAVAIANCTKAGGGVLYVPQGFYTLTQILTLPSNTVIRGDGQGCQCLSGIRHRGRVPSFKGMASE